MNNIKSAKTKALSLGASVFTLAAIVGTAEVANAATFGFSFDNVEGAVSGTVAGTIELPDGDGTGLAATSILVTSAPAALGYTTPFDVLQNSAFIFENSFDVIGGEIAPTSNFQAGLVFPDLQFSSFSLSDATEGASALSPFGDNAQVDGVLDSSSSTLVYTSVPEPSTLLGLLAVGSLGALTRKRK